MSVSNPLIKELKACTVKFLELDQPLTDNCDAIPPFCQALENILQNGLLVRINTFGLWKKPEAWHWLVKMAQNKSGGSSYLYEMSVEKAAKCRKVKTDVGRTRLLLRHCLNSRCLHVPIQLLLESQLNREFYGRDSVLGSEILSQILMSVLLLPSKLQYKLDCDNARFLDVSWQLPTATRLNMVPTKRLGVSLMFVDDKAIAIEVLPDSVASENDQVEVGDVLDEVNSVVLSATMQGNLGQLLKSGGKPITAYVIKARHKGELYSPLVPLLKRTGLQLSQVLNSCNNNEGCAGSSMTYIGHVLTGDRGDVKEIRRAVNSILEQLCDSVPVTLDCHEIGVTVTRLSDSTELMKHPYMQISACGCTVQVPNYFAYIAEDRSVVPENRFICHVFHSDNQELIDNTLLSIGQGFKRTHFAV